MTLFQKIRLGILRWETPILFYRLHRFIFCKTNGKWNSFVTFFLRILNPKVDLPSEGMIKLTSTRLADIVNSIQQDGFHVFDECLDPDTIHKIQEFALETPVRYIETKEGRTGYSSEKIKFKDASSIASPRFQMDVSDILRSKELKNLILDSSLCKIAQEYFGSRPVFDLVAFWWSKPEQNSDLKDYAAQKFHFDMDRIKFLKFFFYLTDVNESTGPHCFVKGSHRFLPKKFRNDRRFSDQEVIDTYGKTQIKQFYGKKGSIFAVDTRGLHKGEPLVSGNRLVFQIEFANSMFGQVYGKVQLSEIPSDLASAIQREPLVYAPIFTIKKPDHSMG